MARPRKTVDEAKVVELASNGYIMEEIGALVGVSVDTLERRFAEAIKKGHLLRNGSLRRQQFALAMKGNVTMCIWLGKQLLKQSDGNHDAWRQL